MCSAAAVLLSFDERLAVGKKIADKRNFCSHLLEVLQKSGICQELIEMPYIFRYFPDLSPIVADYRINPRFMFSISFIVRKIGDNRETPKSPIVGDFSDICGLLSEQNRYLSLQENVKIFQSSPGVPVYSCCFLIKKIASSCRVTFFVQLDPTTGKT